MGRFQAYKQQVISYIFGSKQQLQATSIFHKPGALPHDSSLYLAACA
jgi:hypothetical protein